MWWTSGCDKNIPPHLRNISCSCIYGSSRPGVTGQTYKKKKRKRKHNHKRPRMAQSTFHCAEKVGDTFISGLLSVFVSPPCSSPAPVYHHSVMMSYQSDTGTAHLTYSLNFGSVHASALPYVIVLWNVFIAALSVIVLLLSWPRLSPWKEGDLISVGLALVK